MLDDDWVRTRELPADPAAAAVMMTVLPAPRAAVTVATSAVTAAMMLSQAAEADAPIAQSPAPPLAAFQVKACAPT